MKTNKYLVVGVMSGTSLDGIDLVLCQFEYEKKCWKYETKKSITIPYSDFWKSRLSEAMELSAFDFIQLDIELGELIASCITVFLENENEQPLFIASHGHTIFHRPDLGFTKQIGNGATISALTNLPTICDFRSKDVALAGQGAPLVPIGDKFLFGNYDICLNLGGFSNISYQENGKVRAFDISPCNMPLNLLANELDANYDHEGRWAEDGKLNPKLFDELNQLEYYQLGNIAKTLGKEWFESHFQPIIEKQNISINDKLRTVTEHIVFQITKTLSTIPGENVLVTGGGAFNKFLLLQLNNKNPQKQITIPDTITVCYKEAIIFAFLGLLRWRNEINCLRSVTGAIRNSCGGAIY